MRLDRDICFLDTETLGLDRRAPIWEFAAVRLCRGGDVTVKSNFQIQHNESDWLDDPTYPFADDYRRRYDEATALPPIEAAIEVAHFTEGAIIVGSKPSFDTERLALLLRDYGIEPTWKHHELDIPSMVLGYQACAGVLDLFEWRSEALSRLVGIEPDDYARHTAMGDAEWCVAQWQQMTAKPVLTDRMRSLAPELRRVKELYGWVDNVPAALTETADWLESEADYLDRPIPFGVVEP